MARTAGSFLLIAILAIASAAAVQADSSSLPRFTEEREAAALHFVKKNLPDFLPLLEELKKSSAAQYQQQVREIFRVSEMLADLMAEPKRHDLELKIWKTENRAFLAVAKLSSAKDEEKKALEDQLRELAKELVDFDVQSLEMRAAELERDLDGTKDELARLRENLDKSVKDRFDNLLERVKKRKGT
jgi:hypothetical protein